MPKESDKVSKAVKKYVKKEIKVEAEHKYFDQSISDGTTVINTGIVAPLSLIAQGLDEINRVGDQVKAIRWEVRYETQNGQQPQPATSAPFDDPPQFRLILFWDNQCNGVLPTVSQQVDINGVLQTSSSMSFMARQLLDEKRYHVLYDKVHELNDYAVAQATISAVLNNVNQPLAYFHKVDLKLNHLINFINTTGVIAAQGKGGLFALYITDQGAPSAFLSLISRVTYIDI